jgi:long-chain acyl-CoA synthetase
MPMLAPTVAESTGAEPASRAASRAAETGPSLLWAQVAKRADAVVLRHKDLGVWREVTWSELGESVRACACGLIELGLQPGDRVTILSENRPEWLYADLAIQSAAGITVGIYPTSGASQCGYVAGHADAKIWIVEDQEQYDKAARVRHELPELEWVMVIDPKGVRDLSDPTILTFDDLLERGRELERREPRLLDRRTAEVGPDDTAFIIYTSGTTGPPKGAMHSHRSVFEGARPLLRVIEATDRDETMIYLPMAHGAERFFSYPRLLLVGGVFNFAEEPETLFADVREVAPTLFFGVPRTWEKLKSRIEIGIEEATWLKRRLYHWARRAGERAARAELERRPLPAFARLERRLADWIVLRKLRERLGLHRARDCSTGAAPIAPEMLFYLRGLGLPIREALGQTETHITAFNPTSDIRPGTCGVLVDGVEARVSEEGELLFRGPGLFKGYFKNPGATARAFEGGWFHTGDRGRIDADGYVTLDGRVVDMFVLSTGRNIAPQNSENMLKASDYVMDAVVVGDKRPYLTALIVLDEETVSHYAQTHDVPFSSFADLSSRPEIRRLIQGAVAGVNEHWSDREQIKDFRILKWVLSDDEDELTPTMKVRRRFLCERYQSLIDEMYPDAGA